MTLVEVILKDKGGNIIRELTYPVKNAEKLLNFKSGWVLPDNSSFEFKDGKLTEKKKQKAAKADKEETALD